MRLKYIYNNVTNILLIFSAVRLTIEMLFTITLSFYRLLLGGYMKIKPNISGALRHEMTSSEKRKKKTEYDAFLSWWNKFEKCMKFCRFT